MRQQRTRREMWLRSTPGGLAIFAFNHSLRGYVISVLSECRQVYPACSAAECGVT